MVAVLARDSAHDGGSGGRRGVQRPTTIRSRRRLPPVTELEVLPCGRGALRNQASGSLVQCSILAFLQPNRYLPGGCSVRAPGRPRERPGRGGWGGGGIAAVGPRAGGLGRARR